MLKFHFLRLYMNIFHQSVMEDTGEWNTKNFWGPLIFCVLFCFARKSFMNCVLCNLFYFSDTWGIFFLSSNMCTQRILDYSYSLLGCLLNSCMIYRQTVFCYLEERYYFLCPSSKSTLSDMSNKQANSRLCLWLSEGKQILIPCLRLFFPSSPHIKSWSSSLALVGRGTAGAHHPKVLKAWNKLDLCAFKWHLFSDKCSLINAQLIKQCTPRTLRLLWMFFSLTG